MIKCLSPVAFCNLEAFHFWLQWSAPEWDISLPKDGFLRLGQEYPDFHLYHNGASVCMVDSPIQALQFIGDKDLLQEYVRLITEDPDAPTQ